MSVSLDRTGRRATGAATITPPDPALLRFAVLWATWLGVIVGLTALRALYLAWNWDLFRGFPAVKLLEAFAVGLRFDASAAAFLCVLLLPLTLIDLSPRASRWRWNAYAALLLALTVPLLVLATVDSELVRAVGRRTSVDSLFLYGESDWRAVDIARQFAGLTAAGLFLAGIWVYVVVRGRGWILDAEAAHAHGARGRRLRAAGLTLALLVVSAALLTIAIRGGVTNSKPLTVVHTLPEPQLDNLALNTPFVLIKSLGRDRTPRLAFFQSREALLGQMNGAASGSLLPVAAGPARPLNVVVLVMESLSLGYMGEVNGVAGFTPFLDQLARRSLFFPNAWANAMRSIEGIPAVLGGIPALGDEPMLASPYTTTRFEGLGTLLAKRGYDTAFFHAADRGTMYFDQFVPRAGFRRYYARDDYPDENDYDGAWGVWDEPYFQYVADGIERMHQPFGVVVFSLTAHHPFKVPAALVDRLPDGPIPILKAIAYSDYALRRFFETASTRPWYRDTLFVVTGDHGFLPYLPQYQNDLGRWRVPLILFQPGRVWPQVDTRQPVSQLDIVPTIADVIGVPLRTRNWLGRSVFAPGERVVVLRAENSLFAVAPDYFLFYPLGGGAPQLYRIDDPERRTPLAGHDQIREHLVRRAQAAVQYFNNGLLDGTLLQDDPPGPATPAPSTQARQ